MKTLFIILFLLLSYSHVIGQVDSTSIFENSKGKLPIPIPKYLRVFDNEELKHAPTNLFDSTLRIITDSAYQVKAIYEGRIIEVFEIEHEYSVITQFGNYLICYGRLTKPSLKKGEFIKTGTILGNLVKDWSEENYTLEVRLYKGLNQISPNKWFAW